MIEEGFAARLLSVASLAFFRRDLITGNGENGACPTRFVGAVAMVTFTLKRATGTLASKTSIREHVTVMAQSPDLPPRPAFDRTQVITKGTINDLQAFGYDESDIAEGEREAEREKSRERLWRLCRQEHPTRDPRIRLIGGCGYILCPDDASQCTPTSYGP